ncbi:MAG: restriction endonuclease [Candidatus Helarchaeota archaeon]
MVRDIMFPEWKKEKQAEQQDEKDETEKEVKIVPNEAEQKSNQFKITELKVEGFVIQSEKDFQLRILRLSEGLDQLEKKRESNTISKENYETSFRYLQQQIKLLNYKYQIFLQEKDYKDFRTRTEEIKNWILSVDQSGFMDIIERFFEKNNFKFLPIADVLFEKGFRIADYTQEKLRIQQIFGNRIFIQGIHYFNKLVDQETIEEFSKFASRYGIDYAYIITSSGFTENAKRVFASIQSLQGEYWDLDELAAKYYLSFYHDPYEEIQKKEDARRGKA